MVLLKLFTYLKLLFVKYCGCFCYKSDQSKLQNIKKKPEKCLLTSLYDINYDYFIDENEIINHGHYSVVYKSFCPERGKEVAIKKIEVEKLTKSKLNKVIDEIRIFKKLIHPNINQYYEAYLKNDNLFIIQEYCRGDDLLNYMNIRNGIFSEWEAKLIMIIIK